MAEVKGVEKTLADAGTRISPAAAGGEVHCVVDQYTLNATAVGTILLGGIEIPAGARIVMAELDCGAMGSSVTFALSIGTDTIISATSVASAAVLREDPGVAQTAIAVAGIPTITNAGATSTASDRTVDARIFYTFH